MSNNRKYFGTDGIRGRVGSDPITPDFFLKIGWAAGRVLTRYGSCKIILGKDTRISGYMLESALKAGLIAAGVSVLFIDNPIPTPAIAYFTRAFLAEGGIVISGSHNPFHDNGIKFFFTNGSKIPDLIEKAIEDEIERNVTYVCSKSFGKIIHISDAIGRYIEFCKATFPYGLNLSKLKIIVDCAHGSTCFVAPNVFRELGAKVIEIGCKPNGININLKLGATDIRALQARVINEKADLGIAFDGDGDRLIMVDHEANKIDGDGIIYILAREKQRQGKLYGGVVGTIMSNMGLELALKQLSIPFERSQVGDRFVIETLQKKKWVIGGENSGHIILLDKTTTADGIITALQVMAVMINNSTSLYKLSNSLKIFPQKIINIKFNSNYSNLFQNVKLQKAIIQIKSELGNNGRLLLRKSGTEPLIRIMIEGKDKAKIENYADYIANIIKSISK